MIRARAGHRRCRFDHIKPVHLAAQPLHFRVVVKLPALVKLLHVPQMSGSAGQKIGIQRQDDFGALWAQYRVDVTAERQLSAFSRSVTNRGFPLMPFRLRVELAVPESAPQSSAK